MEEFNLLIGINIELALAKVFFLVVTFLFTIFLIVVLRQVISMHTIVNDASDSLILKSLAVILLIVSISLFLTGLVIL